MSSKLDEISEAIGQLRASVADIQRQIKENRKLQERRHAASSAALRDLAEKIDRHAASVEMIRPTVAALELSRSKLATWATIGFTAVVVLGWFAEAVLKRAVDWTLSHFQ
jgi:prefoldin subunit 5